MNGILTIVTGLLDIILLPVNALIENIFPSMASAVGTFNNFVNNYVGGSLAYFFSILPPIFRNLLTIWFTFVIAYYGIYYSYLAILKIWNVIQKIKFW